uniref:Ovule protein n=1 Tax=Strongyloides papillosus TaxID=174720 RepID=A0A0N5BF18_STREA
MKQHYFVILILEGSSFFLQDNLIIVFLQCNSIMKTVVVFWCRTINILVVFLCRTIKFHKVQLFQEQLR